MRMVEGGSKRPWSQRVDCPQPWQPGLSGEVTTSTKVPTYVKRGSHTSKEKLWDLLSSDRVSPRLGADRRIMLRCK